MGERGATKSSPVVVAVAWLIVLAPMAWGVTHTIQNALKLFATTGAANGAVR
jgi:hypothetical protein